MKVSRQDTLMYLAVLLLAVGAALYHNPLHLHATSAVDGYTLQIPVLWTSARSPDPTILLGLRREWARSASISVTDRHEIDPKNGPWTEENVAGARAYLISMQRKDPRFSNPQRLEIRPGRYPADCEEAALGGRSALTCYMIGTPLQVSFLGDAAYEAEARKLIASLK